MKTKNLLAFFIVFTMMFSQINVFAANEKAKSIRLVDKAGTVTVKKQNGKDVKATDDMRLLDGYTVTTGAKSSASISLDDTKVITVDNSSSIEIKKSGKKLEVLVETGKVLFNVSEKLKDDEALNVKTSNMTMGIRGTYGVVIKEKTVDGEKSSAYLLTGSAELSVNGDDGREVQKIMLSPGIGANITSEAGKKPEVSSFELQKNGEDLPAFVVDNILKNEKLQGELKYKYDIGNLPAVLEKVTLQEEKKQDEIIKQVEENLKEQVIKEEGKDKIKAPGLAEDTPVDIPKPGGGGTTPEQELKAMNEELEKYNETVIFPMDKNFITFSDIKKSIIDNHKSNYDVSFEPIRAEYNRYVALRNNDIIEILARPASKDKEIKITLKVTSSKDKAKSVQKEIKIIIGKIVPSVSPNIAETLDIEMKNSMVKMNNIEKTDEILCLMGTGKNETDKASKLFDLYLDKSKDVVNIKDKEHFYYYKLKGEELPYYYFNYSVDSSGKLNVISECDGTLPVEAKTYKGYYSSLNSAIDSALFNQTVELVRKNTVIDKPINIKKGITLAVENEKKLITNTNVTLNGTLIIKSGGTLTTTKSGTISSGNGKIKFESGAAFENNSDTLRFLDEKFGNEISESSDIIGQTFVFARNVSGVNFWYIEGATDGDSMTPEEEAILTAEIEKYSDKTIFSSEKTSIAISDFLKVKTLSEDDGLTVSAEFEPIAQEYDRYIKMGKDSNTQIDILARPTLKDKEVTVTIKIGFDYNPKKSMTKEVILVISKMEAETVNDLGNVRISCSVEDNVIKITNSWPKDKILFYSGEEFEGEYPFNKVFDLYLDKSPNVITPNDNNIEIPYTLSGNPLMYFSYVYDIGVGGQAHFSNGASNDTLNMVAIIDDGYYSDINAAINASSNQTVNLVQIDTSLDKPTNIKKGTTLAVENEKKLITNTNVTLNGTLIIKSGGTLTTTKSGTISSGNGKIKFESGAAFENNSDTLRFLDEKFGNEISESSDIIGQTFVFARNVSGVNFWYIEGATDGDSMTPEEEAILTAEIEKYSGEIEFVAGKTSITISDFLKTTKTLDTRDSIFDASFEPLASEYDRYIKMVDGSNTQIDILARPTLKDKEVTVTIKIGFDYNSKKSMSKNVILVINKMEPKTLESTSSLLFSVSNNVVKVKNYSPEDKQLIYIGEGLKDKNPTKKIFDLYLEKSPNVITLADNVTEVPYTLLGKPLVYFSCIYDIGASGQGSISNVPLSGTVNMTAKIVERYYSDIMEAIKDANSSDEIITIFNDSSINTNFVDINTPTTLKKDITLTVSDRVKLKIMSSVTIDGTLVISDGGGLHFANGGALDSSKDGKIMFGNASVSKNEFAKVRFVNYAGEEVVDFTGKTFKFKETIDGINFWCIDEFIPPEAEIDGVTYDTLKEALDTVDTTGVAVKVLRTTKFSDFATINKGVTLIIPTGVRLIIDGQLINNGIIDNLGTLNVMGGLSSNDIGIIKSDVGEIIAPDGIFIGSTAENSRTLPFYVWQDGMWHWSHEVRHDSDFDTSDGFTVSTDQILFIKSDETLIMNQGSAITIDGTLILFGKLEGYPSMLLEIGENGNIIDRVTIFYEKNGELSTTYAGNTYRWDGEKWVNIKPLNK